MLSCGVSRYSHESKEQRAKHREIARRYRARLKRKAGLASLRLKDLMTLARARYPQGIPNSPAGRDLVTIVAHHLAALPRNPTQTIPDFITAHAPWFTIAEQEELIVATIASPQRWKADSLAWRLRLTDADRTALKITTIGAIDCTKAQREQRRKAKHAERSRKRRALRKAQR